MFYGDPAKCRDTLLKELHKGLSGISWTKSLARCHIWWPKFDIDIDLCVRNSGMCQDSVNMPQVWALHPWEWPERPWFRVHMDYAGQIKDKWILVIVDAHSKYIDVHISRYRHLLQKQKGCTFTTQKQKGHTFATHGSPRVIDLTMLTVLLVRNFPCSVL